MIACLYAHVCVPCICTRDYVCVYVLMDCICASVYVTCLSLCIVRTCECVLQVSWIRQRDLHILTVGIFTYTTDDRFKVKSLVVFNFSSTKQIMLLVPLCISVPSFSLHGSPPSLSSFSVPHCLSLPLTFSPPPPSFLLLFFHSSFLPPSL